MKSILNAANVSGDHGEFIMGKLPEKPGEISIMTIEQLYKALGGHSGQRVPDSNGSYNVSKYYVYGIVGPDGTNSTAANLQAVGVDCYKNLDKVVKVGQTWLSNGQTIFGGPLYDVYCNSSSERSGYGFDWCCIPHDISGSIGSSYWDHNVSGSTYVAIVRVYE